MPSYDTALITTYITYLSSSLSVATSNLRYFLNAHPEFQGVTNAMDDRQFSFFVSRMKSICPEAYHAGCSGKIPTSLKYRIEKEWDSVFEDQYEFVDAEDCRSSTSYGTEDSKRRTQKWLEYSEDSRSVAGSSMFDDDSRDVETVYSGRNSRRSSGSTSTRSSTSSPRNGSSYEMELYRGSSRASKPVPSSYPRGTRRGYYVSYGR